METLWIDVRHALRSLARRPGLTLTAVLTLGLGLGANAAIFSWYLSMVLEPVPGLHEPGRVVEVLSVSEGERVTSLSYPNLDDVRARTRTLEAVAGHEFEAVSLARPGELEAERVWAELASASFFDVLGVVPVAGRFFRPEEDRAPLGEPVAVLSYAFWQRRFAADPRAVGSVIHVNGHPLTVVGVAPEGFQGGYSGLVFDLWVPLTLESWIEGAGDRIANRGSSWLNALGRLAEGVELEQARAELAAIGDELARAHPENHGHGLTAAPLSESPNGPQRVLGPVLLMLLAFVALLLAVACANVANLLLVRASSRDRELAVRAALGAGRGSLSRLLALEAAGIALAAGGLGLVLAHASAGLLGAFIPPVDLPIRLGIRVDVRVLVFTLALALAAGLVCALAAGRRVGGRILIDALRGRGGSASGGRTRVPLRDGLVVAQVTLSLLLLVGAALFVRSIGAALRHDPGFDPNGVMLAAVDLFPAGYGEADGRVLLERVREHLAALPGVRSVSLARRVPLGFGGSSSSTFEVEGYRPAEGERVWAFVNWVGPEYFSTLRLPLLRGRDVAASDREGSEPVLVINQAAARRYWAGREALGSTIDLYGVRRRVIGVVADSDNRTLGEEPRPFVYLPLGQNYKADLHLIARTAGDPRAVAPALRRAVAELDPRLPVFNVRTMNDVIAASSSQLRVAATLLGVLGALALGIATVGLYGVITALVAQRTHEIGVRMALGADRRRVLALVLARGARLTAVGLLLGTLAALAAGSLIASVLFGVSPADPIAFAAAIGLLGCAAAAATLVPAARAAAVQPISALRAE